MLEARDLASGVINRLRSNLGSLSRTQRVLAGGMAAAAVGSTAAVYELSKFADHSIKAAATFQQSNTLLTTQAGVAKSRINDLGNTFLQWAPKLAQTPEALSEAFYHIASAGVPAREQLGALKAAAMGAAIGNANLEDTTNALVATLRSGVGGVNGAHDAIATLLAIVGAGNMRLQQFVAAMGTGLPGAAKTFGVSLQSAGAALAYLTDTGMGAQSAATRLTMALALLAGPSQHSSKVLGALGLTSDQIHSKFAIVSQDLAKAGVSTSQLASDLRKPDGIVAALTDLKTRMTEAGLSAQTQAAVITSAFGGGHMGKALMQLYESLPKVAQKFGVINSSVSSFGEHWRQTTQMAVFQAHSLHASMSSISTAIGTGLLPAVQKLLSVITPLVTKMAEWAAHHKTLAAIILGVATAASVLVAVIGTLSLAFLALDSAAAPWLLIGAAIVAALIAIGAAVYFILKNWGTIVAFFERLWTDVRRIFHEALDDIVGWLASEWNRITSYAEGVWTRFKGWLSTLWGDIRAEAISAWNGILGYLKSLMLGFGRDAEGIWTKIKKFFHDLWNDTKSAFGNAWDWIKDHLASAWDWIKDKAHTVWDAIKGFFHDLWNDTKSAFGNAWDWIKDHLASAWSWIKSKATSIWNGIKGFFHQTWETTKSGAGNAWDWIKDHLHGVWNDLSKAASATWHGIGWLLSTIWSGLKLAASATWGAIKSATIAVWDALKAAGSAVWGAIKIATIAVWNALKAAASATWGAIKVATEAVWNALKAAASVTWNAIKSAVTTATSLAKTAAVTVWNAAKTALTDVWNTLKTVATTVWNAIKAIVSAVASAIAGPVNAMVGLFKGIVSVLNSIVGAANSAASAIGKVVGAAKSIGHGIGSALSVVGLATGGIVNQPTLAVVGEAGPEAVVPLNGLATGGVRPLPGLGVVGGTSGPVTFELNFNGPGVWKPSDIDNLVRQIGGRLATYLLPSSGMQVRRRT